jgi:hypothetical protein
VPTAQSSSEEWAPILVNDEHGAPVAMLAAMTGVSRIFQVETSEMKEINTMASLAMTLPLLPGKTGDWKSWTQEMAGTRLSEFRASRKRLGIIREASFLQQTPQGDMAMLYIEAEDIGRAFQGLATSQGPFDVLFRQKTQEFFGFDLAQPPSGPLPETVFDWRAD